MDNVRPNGHLRNVELRQHYADRGCEIQQTFTSYEFRIHG